MRFTGPFLCRANCYRIQGRKKGFFLRLARGARVSGALGTAGSLSAWRWSGLDKVNHLSSLPGWYNGLFAEKNAAAAELERPGAKVGCVLLLGVPMRRR
jgi:hypothetical protein